MRQSTLAITLILLLFLTPNLHAESSPPTPQANNPLPASIELTPELDAYYSNIGLHIPLTSSAIPDVGESDETVVYKNLFLSSLTPRFLLLEASIFPMPILGTYLKTNNRSFYNSAGSGDDLNLIGSLTAGFQEPYSFSVFFGDVVTFVKPGEPRNASNKGYMGYLFSFADKHIKDNVLITDKSLEIEWKMKGEKNFYNEKLSWSFRLGAKLHENPEIADVGYIGLRRSNLDFHSSALSWLKNSSFDLKWDFALRDGDVLRQEYIIGKKLPIVDYNFAFKIDFGLIWQSHRSYSGSLRDTDNNSLTVLLRPNIQF